jgi:antirestriction protein
MNAKNNDAAEFRIYIADMAAFNAGHLRGAWVSPAEFNDVSELQDAINAIVTSPEGEWAVHDSERIKIREHESLAVILAIARACEEWGCEKVQAAIDHGIASDLENIGDEIAERDGGEYGSKIDWAYEHIEGCYDLDKMLGSLAHYFDYEAFARDAELGGDLSFIELANGNVWVLNHH